MKLPYLLCCLLASSSALLIHAQNVGIGNTNPIMRLHVSSPDSTVMLVENTQTLGAGVSSYMYFKTGAFFTGGIKMTGQGTNMAKLSLMTYSNFNRNGLLPRLTIMDNGNVGIGTDPAYKLDVNGRMLLRHNAATAGIWLNKADNSEEAAFVGNVNDSTFGIYNQSNNNWKFFFNHKNGNFGLNNDNPRVGLSFSASLGKKVSLYPGGTGDVGFGVYADELRIHTNYVGSDITFGYDTYNSPFVERMRVKGSGAVCIGTTSVASGYLLNVGGKAIAEEVRVQLRAAWPDYVFGENYELPSLEKVDEFIRQNRHLPGIPAAAEIEKDGIMLGDMQTRMMEKIEQLTLYIIQQQKELQVLQNQVLELKQAQTIVKK